MYSEEGARVALPEFEKALALFRHESDRKGEAITIGLIGNCYKRLKDYTKALEYLQRALVMKRELGDHSLEAGAHNNLGLVYDELGNYRRSLGEYNRALELYRGMEP